MEGLKKWAFSKRGNITRLAEGVGVTQSAITMWFLDSKKRAVPIVYAKKIMHTTGLSAKAIYPEMYDLFKDGDYKDGIIERHDELKEKTERLTAILNKIEALHAEAVNVVRELNDDNS